ncbi:MATE family efflux transporter [Acidaminococcus massiliensis]|uniref:MATE family efflux transporter n=1 Tax=Acidaminococcus massiliensis TaxID=1852375 RepID=UPI000A4BCD8F|nr:MATE family efflux transporter [Acidaminococcus massiliensis]
MIDPTPKNSKEAQKYKKMLEAPVKPLIASLALPSIISMLCTSFYNMADTYFVSKIDTTSTAAVGVTFATMAIIHAIAFFFGIGSGNSISRLLGAKKRTEAATMASTSFFYTFLCGLCIAILGNAFAAQLATLIGSTPTILPYAIQYMSVILIGAPVMMCSLVMNNHLRFQGSAAFGMVGITVGGFLNVFLDPLFIFKFHMGVAGAAYATILSQFVSFCILFAMTWRGGNIPIRLGNIHPCWPIAKEIVAGGAPSLVRQGTQSLSTIFLNVAAGAFGDAAIAAMSIVTRLSFFAASVVIGFGQGFQPVCGFSHGAKKYGRLREGFWFAVKAGTLFSLAAAAVAIFWATPILEEFRDDPLVISVGAAALRAQAVTFFLVPLTILSNMCLQTTRHTVGAMLVAAGRSGLFLIPTLMVLPRNFGLTGLVWSQSVSDICGFLLAAVLIRGFFQQIPKMDGAK